MKTRRLDKTDDDVFMLDHLDKCLHSRIFSKEFDFAE